MADEKRDNKQPSQQGLQTRTIPHSIDAEISLLGCILVDGEIALDLADKLYPDDFYSPAHSLLFDNISQLVRSNKAVDVVTLTDNLIRRGELEKIGGAAYLMTIASSVPGSANYKEYLDIIIRTSTMRKLIRSCSTIIDGAYTAEDSAAAVAEAEKLIFDINAKSTKGEPEPISGSIAEVIERINAVKTDKDAYKGVMTGFWALDNLTNGLHAGELIILAARPAMGKSSFAMNIVENAAKKGKSCVVFSLEMPKTQIAQRLLCSCAGIPLSNAVKGDLSDSQWTDLFKTATMLGKFNIFIDDSSMVTPGQILSKCRKLKSQYGLDLLVIDYIQLMSSGRRNVESRQQEVSEISRSLKIMAKELNVPVIALSQLSRQIEMRQGKPQLSDLRESGAIEQDADIVMFIHKEKADAESAPNDDERELIVAKHRNGALEDIPLKWIGELVRFASYSSADAALKKQYKELEAQKKKNQGKGGEDSASVAKNTGKTENTDGMADQYTGGASENDADAQTKSSQAETALTESSSANPDASGEAHKNTDVTENSTVPLSKRDLSYAVEEMGRRSIVDLSAGKNNVTEKSQTDENAFDNLQPDGSARLENISYVSGVDGNFSGEQTEVAVCPENAGQQDISHGDAGNYNGNDGSSFTDTGISVSDIDAYYSQMADDIPPDGYGGMDIPPEDYVPFGQYEDMPSQEDLDMIFGKEGGQTAQQKPIDLSNKAVGTQSENKSLSQMNSSDTTKENLNGSESCDGCKNSENSGKTEQTSSRADGEKEKSAEDKRPPAKKKPVRKTDESVDLPF